MAKPRLSANAPHNYEWVIKPDGVVTKVPTTFNLQAPARVDGNGNVIISDAWKFQGFLTLKSELPADKYAKFVEYQEECTAFRRRKKPEGWAEKWDIEPTTGLPRDCIPAVVAERRGLELAKPENPPVVEDPPVVEAPPKGKSKKGGGAD